MTFRTPGFSRGLRVGGRSRLLIPVAVTLAVLLVLYFVFAGVWTDLLWYRSVGYSSVYTTQLRTQIFLFTGAGLLMTAVVGLNVIMAYRLRPMYRPLSAEQQGLERYRVVIDPHRRAILITTLGLTGILTGISASGQWKVWLAFTNRTSFGVEDPQFGKDISFFVFTYPFLRMILGYAFAIVILSLIAATIVHYLYGGLRLQGPGDKASAAARVHLSVLLGTFVLLKAVAYWVDRWGIAGSERGVVTGPSFTDVNALLPAKTILTVIALICAGLFFFNIVRRGMLLPGVAFTLLVLSAILIGGVYPLLVEQFQVKPNQVDKEAKYIERNIAATRRAYGVDKTIAQPYAAQIKLSKEQVEGEAATIPNVRLLDPAIMSTTFQQRQQLRSFYKFADPLDVDRYSTPGFSSDGTPRDTVIAIREIEGPPAGQTGWVNKHLVYTHGFGVVAAPGNEVDGQGNPRYVEGDPQKPGSLGQFERRVYFGERSPEYSIVGAPKASKPRELDYPVDDQTGRGTGQQNNTYTGKGGVSVGSFFNKMLFATKFGDRNFLLSGAINKDSKILYDRTPRERVKKAAPWLKVDGNPYPVVANGRLQWMVDGYTTASGYPYAEKINLDTATQDTNTERQSVARQSGGKISYMRNSVKATVDAYDGSVKLYAWDEQDPVLKTWRKAFPGTVKPRAELEKNSELLSHVRYPEDYFKIQRRILARYHVQDAKAFYGGQDFWEVPQDPSDQGSGNTQPPYYLSMRMPGSGQTSPQFALTTAYAPRNRPNLAAFMAVDSVPTSKTYGQMRILQVPRSPGIHGPEQVQNTFKNFPEAAQELNLLTQGGSDVIRGNMLTLPFGGGFLYVEPVYVRAKGGGSGSYPLLKKVLVSFGGDAVGYAPTFRQALEKALEGGGAVTETTQTPATTGEAGKVTAEMRSAIAEASKAWKDGQAALAKGDWQKYGEAQKRLQDALDRLSKLQADAKAKEDQAKKSPSPSPSKPASPSPKPTS